VSLGANSVNAQSHSFLKMPPPVSTKPHAQVCSG